MTNKAQGCKHAVCIAYPEVGMAQVRVCVYCHDVVPWGPATMTPRVQWEIAAADVAAIVAEQLLGPVTSVTVAVFLAIEMDPIADRCYPLEFGEGWESKSGLPVADGDDSYAAGALARAILDHEDEI